MLLLAHRFHFPKNFPAFGAKSKFFSESHSGASTLRALSPPHAPKRRSVIHRVANSNTLNRAVANLPLPPLHHVFEPCLFRATHQHLHNTTTDTRKFEFSTPIIRAVGCRRNVCVEWRRSKACQSTHKGIRKIQRSDCLICSKSFACARRTFMETY